jgi:putative flippase GtrA
MRSLRVADRLPLQLVRFGIVGVTNTALTAATYAVLRVGGTPSLIAAPIGFAVGAVNGYVWNGRWTFHARPRGAARRYVLVQLGALCATDALLAGGLPYLGVLACVTAGSFVVCRRWAFRVRSAT